MSKKQIPTTQKSITNSLGRYPRAMETDTFVYFVNFSEGDENGMVFMYRKEETHLELVSDNYFAHVGLMEDLKDCSQTWMSPQMKKERKIYTEEVILPLVKEYVELSVKGHASILSKDGQRFNELEQEIDEYYVTLPEMDVCAFLQHKFSL